MIDIHAELRALGSPEKAVKSAIFFKTGPGQYGEGDVFLGVTMPEMRLVAKRHLDLDGGSITGLLCSPEHEFRMTALLIWTYQFARGDEAVKRAIYEAYLANTRWINNWDLVDASCAEIVGGYVSDKDRSVLDRLAVSNLIWERRIAMVATYYFIKNGQSDDALRIADILKNDRQDLMQKAVGWMLREVGKRCGLELEVGWLAPRYQKLPRTMLRYAIERFEPAQRAAYLSGKI